MTDPQLHGATWLSWDRRFKAAEANIASLKSEVKRLVVRKAHYKDLTYELQLQITHQEATMKILDATARFWQRSAYAAVCAFALISTLFIVVCAARSAMLPAAPRNRELVAETKDGYSPNVVLASINMDGCSGIVVSRDADPEKWAQVISAKHCIDAAHWQRNQTVCATNVRNERFTCYLQDVGQDDTCLWLCKAKYAVDVLPVAEAWPLYPCKKMAVGYPLCGGPVVKQLANSVELRGDKSVYHVTDGQFWLGDSGGGVCVMGCAADESVEGLLVGTIHGCAADENGNPINEGTAQVPTSRTMHTTQHSGLIALLRKNRRPDCGNGICPIRPGPNVPIVAPPPATHAAPPAAEPAAPPYNGHGHIPEDLRGRKNLASEVDKLRKHEPLTPPAEEHGHVAPPSDGDGQKAPIPPPAEKTAPAPPLVPSPDFAAQLNRVEARLHARLDELNKRLPVPLDTSKLTQDLISKIPIAATPDQLKAFEQRMLAAFEAHGGNLREALQAAPQDFAQAAKPLVEEAAGNALAAAKPGLLAGLAAVVPGVGTILGAGGLGAAGLAAAGWFLSRATRKNTDALLAQGHASAQTTSALKDLLGHLLTRAAPTSPAGPLDSGGTSAAPTPQSDSQTFAFGLVEKLLGKVLSGSAPQSPPAAAGAFSCPAPASVRSTPATIIPVQVADPAGQAFQQAIAQVLQRNPGMSLLNAVPAIQATAQTILDLQRPVQTPVGQNFKL